MAENVFTRKIGPLPTWAWTAIIGGVVVLWAYYQNRKQSQSANSGAYAPDTVPPQIDQFQILPPTQGGGTDEDDDDPRHGKIPGEKLPPGGWRASRSTDIQADAMAALARAGIKNPTKQQIAEERQDILQSARADVRKKKTPVERHTRHKHHHRVPARGRR